LWRSLDQNQLDRRFLYYFMGSREFIEQWRARKGETDMADYVSLSAQRKLWIVLPEIREQRTIADILEAFDLKLELNHQTNETLEGMARALFKSWFIDFDPVVARAAGRRTVGLTTSASRLFPATFSDSDLGLIPQGWHSGWVGSEFELTMGQSPPGETYSLHSAGQPEGILSFHPDRATSHR
jgi:type I restriction enzyme S subunit